MGSPEEETDIRIYGRMIHLRSISRKKTDREVGVREVILGWEKGSVPQDSSGDGIGHSSALSPSGARELKNLYSCTHQLLVKLLPLV